MGVQDRREHKRMGAARPASRTPGTVPGLPHPNPHGRHTEAHMEPKPGREEAARELIWRANSELVERLLSIMNREDNPGLSTNDNKRHRYADILAEMDIFFHKIGHDELGTYIVGLGVALEDLIEGVTDPLFVTKGSKRDSMRIWGARLQAALGVECFITSGLSRKEAAGAAKDYKELARLKRGENRDLEGSLLSWYDRYVEGPGEGPGRVPVPQLLEAFQETRRELKAANRSQAEDRRIGELYFAEAVKSASR